MKCVLYAEASRQLCARYKKSISTGMLAISTCEGAQMEWSAVNTPIWLWAVGFVIGVVELINAHWPIIPFRLIGWRDRSKHVAKLNIRAWQGREDSVCTK